MTLPGPLAQAVTFRAFGALPTRLCRGSSDQPETQRLIVYGFETHFSGCLCELSVRLVAALPVLILSLIARDQLKLTHYPRHGIPMLNRRLDVIS